MHDIRSPAQSLTLLADLMSDPDTEVEQILRESCGHLARSLDLLSRVLHPAPPAAVGPISVREPVRFIAELHHAGRNRSRVVLQLDASLPAVTGVERHLEHALLNLVLYATEALQSREGGLIRIAAAVQEGGVDLTVSDNRPAISSDQAAKLFDPPSPAASDPLLAATGLLVAREVVGLSGGSLVYAPVTEGDARFVITLPLWRRAAPGIGS